MTMAENRFLVENSKIDSVFFKKLTLFQLYLITNEPIDYFEWGWFLTKTLNQKTAWETLLQGSINRPRIE